MNRTATRNHTYRALSLAASLALAGVAPARADQDRSERYFGTESHWTADGNIVDVRVRVDGSAAPLFFKPGTSDRHYFQAFKGRNYSLVIRNTTGRRVGVVIAVDGVNVVNGERSNPDRHEPMYVLDPWEQADIRGWRTSLSEVRRFVFVDEERSYASRTGQANGDMGWIRVVAFREVERTPWLGGWYRSRPPYRDERSNEPGAGELGRGGAASPAPGASDAPEAQRREAPSEKSQLRADDKSTAPESDGLTQREQESSPGTGWGQRHWDPVQETQFEAERWPSDRITLRYEYAAGLRALGIFPRRPRLWERERGELGFAGPPRW